MARGSAKRAAASEGTPRRLADLDGIGPAMLGDLDRLGVRTVAALARREPRALYDRLCDLTGQRQDPCVLDTFACAVAQARDARLPAARRRWWWWSRKRLAERARR